MPLGIQVLNSVHDTRNIRFAYSILLIMKTSAVR
jgi:hypothetical protein